ncbi:titin-like isoform X2 [Limulus polyphemus]|uniref:Titin-like isoform X2 n=1 Tax=Limulus polyphemus TaxID=6850 RepID=A0ABM1SR59_LIMPO|nr:titin-like isoform X2 [Limulus polyphemus]
MSTLICQASNNNMSLPLSSSITLNMNFRPLTVTIVEKRLPLSSGKMVQLECRTNGSRPPAEITWWKGSTQLRSTKNRTNKDETLTSSFLTIRPSREDAGKYLSCKAENPNMPNSAIEDGWVLEVYYPPELTLRLGSKLRHSHIQEGNDVYFECNIRANPWVTEIRWEFERRELQTNTTVGIIVSNQSLVLQKVRRSSRGHYICSARNSEGVRESNAVYLRVQYAPICKPDQRAIYGVPKHDGVKVRCEVDADPSSVTFKWAFNNSVERLDIVDFVTSGTESLASYIPRTEYDYGTLLCWARNSVGTQRQPCGFLVIPAGVPDPVHNCSVFNETDHSFRVECEAGYNGGLGQHFVMEVLDTPYLQLQANMTSPFPIFRARNLPSSSSFVVLVYAVNVRGASQKHFLRVNTHASPETQAHNVSNQWRLAVSSMLIILVSVAVGIILVAILTIFVIRYRRKKGRENGNKESEYKSKRNPEKYDSPASLNVLPVEEKCPDLIPGNSVHLHANPSPDLKNHDGDELSTPPLLRTTHEMLDRSAREFSPTERLSLTAPEPLSDMRDLPYSEGQRRVKKVLPARKHVEEQWFPFNSNHTNV